MTTEPTTDTTAAGQPADTEQAPAPAPASQPQQLSTDTPAADAPPDRAPRRRRGVTGGAARSKNSQPAAAPTAAPAAPAAAPQRRKRAPKREPVSLREPLQVMLTQLGALAGVVNPVDGLIVVSNAEQFAGALDQLAQENDSVRNALEKLVTGSAWAQVVGAAAAIALPIMANHGVKLPAGDRMLQPYREMLGAAAEGQQE